MFFAAFNGSRIPLGLAAAPRLQTIVTGGSGGSTGTVTDTSAGTAIPDGACTSDKKLIFYYPPNGRGWQYAGDGDTCSIVTTVNSNDVLSEASLYGPKSAIQVGQGTPFFMPAGQKDPYAFTLTDPKSIPENWKQWLVKELTTGNGNPFLISPTAGLVSWVNSCGHPNTCFRQVPQGPPKGSLDQFTWYAALGIPFAAATLPIGVSTTPGANNSCPNGYAYNVIGDSLCDPLLAMADGSTPPGPVPTIQLNPYTAGQTCIGGCLGCSDKICVSPAAYFTNPVTGDKWGVWVQVGPGAFAPYFSGPIPPGLPATDPTTGAKFPAINIANPDGKTFAIDPNTGVAIATTMPAVMSIVFAPIPQASLEDQILGAIEWLPSKINDLVSDIGSGVAAGLEALLGLGCSLFADPAKAQQAAAASKSSPYAAVAIAALQAGCPKPPSTCPPGSIGNAPTCACAPGSPGIYPTCLTPPTPWYLQWYVIVGAIAAIGIGLAAHSKSHHKPTQETTT